MKKTCEICGLPESTFSTNLECLLHQATRREYKRWFAWYPVKTEDNGWTWFTWTWKLLRIAECGYFLEYRKYRKLWSPPGCLGILEDLE